MLRRWLIGLAGVVLAGAGGIIFWVYAWKWMLGFTAVCLGCRLVRWSVENHDW